MKTKMLTELVTRLLRKYPDLQDSDTKLVATMWRSELAKQSLPQFDEFFNILLSGRLSHPDTITRARRKVQENNPLLRGKKYEQRQNAEKQYRQQIKLF